jgi:hypothetical protein
VPSAPRWQRSSRAASALRRGQPEKIVEAVRALVAAVHAARQPHTLRRAAP